MDQAWGDNPFAQRTPFGRRKGEDWDDFSEESSDQVVYQNETGANLISLYRKALQPGSSRHLPILKDSTSLPGTTKQKLHARKLGQPAEPFLSHTQRDSAFQPVFDALPTGQETTKEHALRPSQWIKDSGRQGRRPSLDPVGSFDSPVGWDDAPQEDFTTLVTNQAVLGDPLPDYSGAAAKFKEPGHAASPPPPQKLPAPLRDSERGQQGQGIADEKARSLLDAARDTWAQPPAKTDKVVRDTRVFDEDPFQEAGSLGLGWTQQSDRPGRKKGQKAAVRRPKFSIRPQHRPSLTQSKANIGIGLAPLAQRLKQLAESSQDAGGKKVLRPAPIAEEEEIEQDDIDEHGYHFANNDGAPGFEEDEIDAEIDAPESTARVPEPPAPLDQYSLAVVPAADPEVERREAMPVLTPAGTSGRNLTSQFRNALQAATDEGDPFMLTDQADWNRKQPVGVLAQLQSALQRQRNQELFFSKALQSGQLLEQDLRDCLDVRILETSMEAHLLKCTCEVLHEPEDPGGAPGPAGESVYVLFKRKSHPGLSFEPGRVVRIHPPWLNLTNGINDKRVFYNIICCHNVQ